MMNLRQIILATTLLALPASSLLAQSTTYKQRHTIASRSANQQARINKGVADGQITPGGAARADKNQARINSEDQRMRSRDNGHLTSTDRHRLARQQDATSRGIYDRNHNRATDPGVVPNTPR